MCTTCKRPALPFLCMCFFFYTILPPWTLSNPNEGMVSGCRASSSPMTRTPVRAPSSTLYSRSPSCPSQLPFAGLPHHSPTRNALNAGYIHTLVVVLAPGRSVKPRSMTCVRTRTCNGSGTSALSAGMGPAASQLRDRDKDTNKPKRAGGGMHPGHMPPLIAGVGRRRNGRRRRQRRAETAPGHDGARGWSSRGVCVRPMRPA